MTTAPATTRPRETAWPRRPDLGPRLRLVLLSFLMLFVELALIRWTAANVVYLAFFTNFVLLASFLGIGIGFLRARRDRDSFGLAPVVLVGLVGFVLAFPVQVTVLGRHYSGIFGMPALPQWVTLPVIFLAATAIMAFVAEGVARTFVTFPPLEAYRLDIMGSVLGIGAFSLIAFLRMPPIAWGVGAGVLFLLLLGPRLGRLQLASIVGLVALLAVQSALPFERWSPYYKVTVHGPRDNGIVALKVNNIPHQSIYPLPLLRKEHRFYLFPYERAVGNPLGNVLIVGAGTGNDVSVALSEGAGRIDAVEIDPVLQAIGRDMNPARPYQDPRVDVHIGDGRAFLERTHERYDLILFALPDSLTLIGGQSALRLESYLFTVEAMEVARDHLAPGGVFSVYNYYGSNISARLANTLEQVYGNEPCVDTGSAIGRRRQVVLTVATTPGVVRCATETQPVLSRFVPEPATDDHPFPYLVRRAIPIFYALPLAFIVLVSILLVRGAAGRLGKMREYLDLFFMGGAFLLLETKNVVQFALLYGTTWFVNALVFTGILLTVLGAIEVARRVRLPRPGWLYAALILALGVAWVVPQHALLALPVVARFFVATVVAFTPIFLANLVFSQRFKDVGSSGIAFGANLLGAMIGGVLEYGALVTGYRALLLVVAALYGLAFLFGRRTLAPAT